MTNFTLGKNAISRDLSPIRAAGYAPQEPHRVARGGLIEFDFTFGRLLLPPSRAVPLLGGTKEYGGHEATNPRPTRRSRGRLHAIRRRVLSGAAGLPIRRRSPGGPFR